MDSHEGLRPELKTEILGRLRKIEGQIRGVQRMIEEERPCRDTLIQLAAAKSAVVSAAMTILSNEMAACITRETARGVDPEEALSQFMDVFKKFS
jgi:DNA-binding FrmR family transcriptional regulator